MADGISAVDIGMLLFDVEPNAEPVRDRGALAPAARRPRGSACSAAPVAGIARHAAPRSARWLRRAADEPGRAAPPRRRRPRRPLGGDLEPGPAGAEGAVQHRDRPAPQLLPGRPSTWPSSSRIKNALGGTVNDVTLAVAAGALRAWLLEREVDADGLELKALVPVSIRTENEHGELGNKLTAMRGPLPVGIADPVERLRARHRGDGRR